MATTDKGRAWDVLLREALLDILCVGGAVFLAYGAWMAWEPAGFMAGGALMIAGSIAMANKP